MKKTLALVLAIVMALSCAFVLSACGGSNYDGEYTFDKMELKKFTMNGEDMSELMDAEDMFDAEDTVGASIKIEGNKMTFVDAEDGEDQVVTFEEKGGKLVLDKKSTEELLGDISEEGLDSNLYFKVNGKNLEMYVEMSGADDELGLEMEVSIVATFKKK